MAALSLEALSADVRRLEGEVRQLQNLLTAPLIEKTPGVVGGSARIARTRIPVWTLESYRRQGLTDAQLLDSFPSLRAVDLAAAWAYAEAHPSEIERDIQENDEA
jgi:uncharacterized protein (DUF433 family)